MSEVRPTPPQERPDADSLSLPITGNIHSERSSQEKLTLGREKSVPMRAAAALLLTREKNEGLPPKQ